VTLHDGQIFILRKQNAGGADVTVKSGDRVGIALAPGAACLIKE